MTDDISAWKQDIADVWNRLHTLEHRLQVRNTAKGDAPPPPPPPCVAAAQLVIPPPSASSTHDAIIPAAQHHQHTRHHDPVLELLHKPSVLGVTPTRPHIPPPLRAHPRAQWIQCDLSSTDLTPLGKFGVVMLDPPWCPGATGSKGSKANTLPDDVIKGLALDRVQDEGLILLWVAGRAIDVGYDCLQHWGYTCMDELLWVKPNMVGPPGPATRMGPWLRHAKEHCLVGIKGQPGWVRRGVVLDVIIAEGREAHRKPDEVYTILERLAPGVRKLELFARPNNIRPGWVSLGIALQGVELHDPVMKVRYEEHLNKEHLNKEASGGGKEEGKKK